MHSERVTYLSTADQKAALEAFAAARGESVGSVLREAAAHYMGRPTPDEEAELSALAQQVNEAIPRINASLRSMSKDIRKLRDESDAFYREKGLDL